MKLKIFLFYSIAAGSLLFLKITSLLSNNEFLVAMIFLALSWVPMPFTGRDGSSDPD